MTILVSFDIDGTLEAGDPPGPITMNMVRNAAKHGCIIGSSSDRPLPVQQAIWDRYRIQVSFVSNKHGLVDVKSRFPAEEYYHVGDTDLDRQFATEAGFHFVLMDAGGAEPWINGRSRQD
ncbi:MAG: HAD family hydrolase [Dehalococcoidia bacterium]